MSLEFGKHMSSLIRQCGQAVLAVCLTLTALCFPVFSAQTASPQETSSVEKSTLTLRSFTIETKSGTSILVESGLAVTHISDIRTLLRDGASINLSCNLVIERLRTFLANETLADATVVYQLRHDPLTREFIMAQDGISPQRSKKLEELLAFTDVLMFNIPLAAPLVSGETYRVHLHMTLQHAEVPPWLEKALFFWSWDIAPALSFTQEFIY